MQKVLTVVTHTNLFSKQDKSYLSLEYEELNNYLADGFNVVQVIPYSTNATDSYRYTLTFVLEKVDLPVNPPEHEQQP